MTKRKYTILTEEERVRAAGLVSQYLKDFPKASTLAIHNYVRQHEGLGHATYQHVKTILKRITRFRRKYTRAKKGVDKIKTVVQNGQHTWTWPNNENTSVGSCKVTYTTTDIDLAKQAIALLKAAIVLLEGDKNA